MIWPLFIFQPHFLLLPVFTLCLRNRNYLQLLDHIILLFSLLPRVSYIYFPLYLGVSHPLFPGLLHFASGVPAWKSSCPGLLPLWAGQVHMQVTGHVPCAYPSWRLSHTVFTPSATEPRVRSVLSSRSALPAVVGDRLDGSSTVSDTCSHSNLCISRKAPQRTRLTSSSQLPGTKLQDFMTTKDNTVPFSCRDSAL